MVKTYLIENIFSSKSFDEMMLKINTFDFNCSQKEYGEMTRELNKHLYELTGSVVEASIDISKKGIFYKTCLAIANKSKYGQE